MTKFIDQKLHDFDLTKSGQVSDGEYDPPQLSAAVAHAMPSGAGPLFDLDPYREAMPKVFKHFYERLTKGLDEAWKSSWGYGGDIIDSPEENWARQFAEMFIFTSYMGVAEAYKTKHGEEGRWDMEYSMRLAYGEEDPAYPIVGACQHLSNHMLLTRGFPVASLGTDGIGAGVNLNLPCFSAAYGGSWTVTSTAALTEIGGYRGVAAVRKKLIDAGKGDLTPGSQFGFNADGPAPKKWNDTHIGGVLRIWPEKGPGSQYQPMDTGVLAGSAEGGTEDHSYMTSIAGMPNKMVGIGVVKSVKPSAALIQFLTTARPLGYAHLIVADAGGIVRYISRALPMHLGEKGFAISRYIWSVRCFPANGRAIWLLSIPQVGELSKVLLARGARSRTLRDMVPEASATRIQNAIAKGRKKPDVLQPKNGQILDPVNVIASTTGIPDQGHIDRGVDKPAKGAPRWRGYTSGAVIFRHKRHGGDKPENVWIRFRGADEPVVQGKPFPQVLMELKFVEGGKATFADRWAAMAVDEEYMCEDKNNAQNPQGASISAGVTYFSGALEQPPPKDERVIAGKRGKAPLDEQADYEESQRRPPAWAPEADPGPAPDAKP